MQNSMLPRTANTFKGLIWSMIGPGVQKQLFDKIFLVLDRPEKFKSKIRDFYRKRARLVHGQLNFTSTFAENELESEAVKRATDFFDAQQWAEAMLLAAFQYLAARNLREIEFELVKKPLLLEPARVSGLRVGNGGSWMRVGEPVTVAVKVLVRWVRPEIDLAELARLRLIEGWTFKQLAKHFGRSPSVRYRALQRKGGP